MSGEVPPNNRYLDSSVKRKALMIHPDHCRCCGPSPTLPDHEQMPSGFHPHPMSAEVDVVRTESRRDPLDWGRRFARVGLAAAALHALLTGSPAVAQEL